MAGRQRGGFVTRVLMLYNMFVPLLFEQVIWGEGKQNRQSAINGEATRRAIHYQGPGSDVL